MGHYEIKIPITTHFRSAKIKNETKYQGDAVIFCFVKCCI